MMEPMKLNKGILHKCALMLGMPIVLAVTVVPTGARAEQVVVGVESGRVFSGEIDKRTNRDQLWLRTENSSTQISRPIDWKRVSVIRSGGRELSIEDLRAKLVLQNVAKTTNTDESSEELPSPKSQTLATNR